MSNTFAISAAPAIRAEQDAADDVGMHAAGLQELDGGHRVAVLLHQYPVFNEIPLAVVLARAAWLGAVSTARMNCRRLIHR